MATTTSSRSHGHTYPDSGQDPWFTTFQSYAQGISDDLDNLGTTAISQVLDNATGAVVASFSHVASGCYITFSNATAGNGALITVGSSGTNENLRLEPKGSGNLILDGFTWPNADGTANQILKTNGSAVLGFVTLDITTDTAPVLGGNLDVSTFSIISSGANHVPITSANDIVLKLGDAAGAKKVRVKDSANAEVASINSDGLLTVQSLSCTTVTANSIDLTTQLALTKVDINGGTSLSSPADDDKVIIWDTSASVAKVTTIAEISAGRLEAYAHIATPGGTASITGNNIASVTDLGTGSFELNFTTAMSATTYTVLLTVGMSGSATKVQAMTDSGTNTVSKAIVKCYNSSGTLTDPALLTVAVFI